ncbi:putative O-methyltransferase [Phaeosphaeria sp. MPI-PUGE-AT-0046c]|nr:putative O-methyltransferase [Phaeosphaeria sp. MPI-PUGE-AT-0046c]
MAPSIAELSQTIAHHTKLLDAHFAEHGLPAPTFAASAPVDLDLPLALEHSRNVVLAATQDLHDLLLGPRELLFAHTHNLLLPLHFIHKYKIASHVPLDAAVSYADLAEKADLDEDRLTRILRLGIARRVFVEPEAGRIAHSSASRLMKEDERMEAWVGAGVEDMAPAAGRVVEALGKWGRGTGVGETGFALANGGKSFYEVIASDPLRAKRFGLAMSNYSQGDGYSLQHVVAGFDWASLVPGAHVVDIGGSLGDVGFELASAFPSLHITVQDLPEVIAQCKPQGGVNVEFAAHDFFQEQPVKHADVYVLRWILHNWPDAYCHKILQALVPALKKGAKVLVMDGVTPPMGVLPNTVERKVREMDVTMMEIGNAKERSEEEWKALVGALDKRFVWKGLKTPEGSRLSVVEWEWEG